MGPKRKPTLAEQLEELRAQVQRQDAELKKKNQELAEVRAKQPSKRKLIPRPQGQAGRSKNGYNLQAEMRLSGDSGRFQRLSRLVRSYTNEYLPTGKTISQQEKPKLEKTIKLIQHELKYFQRFQGAWPIKALIKQYLQNCQDKRKRTISNTAHPKARAGEDLDDDYGEWNGGFDDHDAAFDEVYLDDPLCDDEYQNSSFSQTHLDDADWGDLVDNPDGTKAHSHSSNKENHEPEETFEHKPKIEKRGKKQPRNVVVGSMPPSPAAKRKAPLFTDDPEQPIKRFRKIMTANPPTASKPTAPKRKVLEAPVFSPSSTKKSESKPASRQIHRKSTAPDDLPGIFFLFSEQRDLLAKDSKNTAGYRTVTSQICEHIKRENLSTLAQVRGWPTSVDFDGIPERVLAMQNNILGLARDSDELGGNPIWLAFLKYIKYHVYSFSARPDSFPDAMQRSNLCGYFGQKGKQIITEVVEGVLSQNTGPDQILHTIASLVDTPRQWDETDDDTALISEADFVDHILVPYLTVCLVSDDLQINFPSAMKVLEESDTFSKLFNPVPLHPDSSKRLQSKASAAPMSKKRKVELVEPMRTAVKPVKLTLQNFPPPVVKKKKSAVEKENKQKLVPRQPKNEPSSSIPVPTKVYSTRSKVLFHF
ncbi:hypothetical protein B0H13DRAFT_2350087 [Mycena leptocephala]|nr:hypothetical protein B0H13DRAFT_2350087 [Mycena leptocephala]